MTPYMLPGLDSPSKIGCMLKENNLLLVEQSLPLKSLFSLRREAKKKL